MRPRAWTLLPLLLAASCATTQTPRLVWMHSDRPVTGVRVTATAEGRLRVVDRRSALVLFDGNAAPGEIVRIAEPLRVRGSIAGAASDVRVRIGSGPREPAIERAYRAIGRLTPDNEKTRLIHGLALPPSPSRWDEASVRGEQFESGWIRADADAQIVAFDGEGRVSVRDVPMPAAVAAHAVIDAGRLELETMPAIDIDVTLPATDVPVALLAGVSKAVIEPELRDPAARLLSALDQIDVRLFNLWVVGRGLTLPHSGKALVRFLPPFSSADVYVRELHGADVAARTVALRAGTVTPVRLALEDVVRGRTRETGVFRGRVVRGDGKIPVGGATVVVSDFPTRRETVTDFAGRFAVDGIRFDRRLTVLVDHATAETHVFRFVDPSTQTELTLPVRPHIADDLLPPPQLSQMWPPANCAGGTPPLAPDPAPTNMDVGIDEAPPLPEPDVPTPAYAPLDCPPDENGIYGSETSWVAVNPANVFDSVNWTGVWTDPTQPGTNATMYVCTAGLWMFYYAPTPFAVMGAGYDFCGQPAVNNACPQACAAAGCLSANVSLALLEPEPLVPTVTLTFTDEQGAPIENMQVLFSPYPPFSDYEAVEYTTDNDGNVSLCGVQPQGLTFYFSYNPTNSDDGDNVPFGIQQQCQIPVSATCVIQVTADDPCTCRGTP